MPRIRLTAAVVLLAVLLPLTAASEPPKPAALRIGVVSGMFRDFPKSAIPTLLKPFEMLMETQGGIRGQVQLGGDGPSLGKLLAEGQVDLGVFIGYEFAWARQQYPQLQPLVIGVNQRPQLRACLVVKEGCAAEGFDDLKGKVLALPYQSRPHCRLFAERRCRACGCAMESWLADIATPANEEDALDDVVDGLVDATVVDHLALEAFQQRKPGRFARLRTACLSEVFPTGVIAHAPGALDPAVLERLRQTLLHAHENKKGQQMLAFTGLTHFAAIPSDYDHVLADIARAYPPQASTGP